MDGKCCTLCKNGAGWAVGQASGVAAIGAAVAYIGYTSAILSAAIGFALLGFWLRSNMARLHA